MDMCFWQQFASAGPDIFCEARGCSFIVEPANTWSNIGYLIAAIAIYRSEYAATKTRNLFFASTLFLFFGSTLLHMSGSYIGRVLDWTGMYAVSACIITLNLERFFKISLYKTYLLYALILVLSLTLFYFKFAREAFVAQLVCTLFLETKMAKSDRVLNMSKIALAVGLILIAFGFWLLDVKKIFCFPDNHILTGHAIWHLLAAASIWTFFSSYRQSKGQPKVNA